MCATLNHCHRRRQETSVHAIDVGKRGRGGAGYWAGGATTHIFYGGVWWVFGVEVMSRLIFLLLCILNYALENTQLYMFVNAYVSGFFMYVT